MNKIMRLKKWMTPEATAKSLTLSLDEEVTVADIYQLALEKEIAISVVFPHKTLARQPASPGPDAPLWYSISTEAGELLFDNSAHSFDDDNSEDFSFIDGVWDLHIEGDGQEELEREFYRINSDVVIAPMSKVLRRYTPGLIVLRHPENKNYVQLYERCRSQDAEHLSHEYHSAGKLPDDCRYVVRTDERRRFERHIAGPDFPSAAEDWVSTELALVNEAARQWWSPVERDHDYPRNKDVNAWLLEKGISSATRRERAVSIIRPDWAR